ncbi:hypothetical protein SAMN05421759_102314 [Roseivivax lentus]|uniref:Uncharacterized protein n=1 Tax=Roseivivax lentus TaxID=633194 RepID=A0A1N7L2E0_9RHOB|nr:hypothetical protein [Roseivivax lentus]SIS68032.1 hypothetical protein SAMN05421759_102314 [Roseivivax lentus]
MTRQAEIAGNELQTGSKAVGMLPFIPVRVCAKRALPGERANPTSEIRKCLCNFKCMEARNA